MSRYFFFLILISDGGIFVKVRGSDHTKSLFESVAEPGSTRTVSGTGWMGLGAHWFAKITQLPSFLGLDQAWVLRRSFQKCRWPVLVRAPFPTDHLGQQCVSKEAGGGEHALWSLRRGQGLALPLAVGLVVFTSLPTGRDQSESAFRPRDSGHSGRAVWPMAEADFRVPQRNFPHTSVFIFKTKM